MTIKHIYTGTQVQVKFSYLNFCLREALCLLVGMFQTRWKHRHKWSKDISPSNYEQLHLRRICGNFVRPFTLQLQAIFSSITSSSKSDVVIAVSKAFSKNMARAPVPLHTHIYLKIVKIFGYDREKKFEYTYNQIHIQCR